ncbi:hypothetical protein ACFL4D_02735 [Candidatus Margulisiibacteriota bacterium]
MATTNTIVHDSTYNTDIPKLQLVPVMVAAAVGAVEGIIIGVLMVI